MPSFEVSRNGMLWDATAVPNVFFCEYMPAAPEGYVKVYLYGLMWAHSGITEEGNLLAEMARALKTDEDELQRALRYWERCRLVERTRDDPPRYRFVSAQQVMLEREQMPSDEEYEAFAQAVYSAFGDRRKLHGGETVLAYEWVEQFHLPAEVVLMLIQHMISTRGVNFSFKDAQKTALELCEQNVKTIEDAEVIFSRSQAARKGARKILTHWSMKRDPTADETDLYIKWTKDWCFEPEAILSACSETTKASSPTFAYLDKILESIRKIYTKKVLNKEDVTKALESRNTELADIREMLGILGIGMDLIGENLRKTYREMCDIAGAESVLIAAKEVRNSRKAHTLDNVNELLQSWQETGLTNADDIRLYLAEVAKLNAQLKELSDIAATSVKRVKANRDCLNRWLNVWKLPWEVITTAAEQGRSNDKLIEYMDKLLTDWHSKGITTAEEALAASQAYRADLKKQQANAASQAPAKRVIEQQYQQRDYDPDEFDGFSEEQLEAMKKYDA